MTPSIPVEEFVFLCKSLKSCSILLLGLGHHHYISGTMVRSLHRVEYSVEPVEPVFSSIFPDGDADTLSMSCKYITLCWVGIPSRWCRWGYFRNIES